MPIEEILAIQTTQWRSGDPISIEQLLERHALSPQALSKDDLLSLICNEVRLREMVGETPALLEFQNRFPWLTSELETQWDVDSFLTHEFSEAMIDGEDDEFERIIPEYIGRYEVLREIARGAQAIVYEAHDSRLNRTVAIKRLRTDDPLQLERFRTEVDSVGVLKHQHIVQVFDVGVDRDGMFIVMEYCDGGTLADLIHDELLPVNKATQFGLQIASAIATTHAAGIVHRDLKPANILISRVEGVEQAKVTDFGLAKWLHSETSSTMTGVIVGSPAYMPPEQALGDKVQIGPTADVYSLGAILYQMLSGRPPFVGSSIADAIYHVQHSEPVRLRQLNSRVPAPLETIVAKCLNKDPRQRYVTAQNLFDDLQRFHQGKPILAKPERLHQRVGRVAKRNPVVASMIALSCILAIGITTSSTWLALRLSRALDRAEQSERATKEKQAEALLGEASGRRLSALPGRRLLAHQALQRAVEVGHQLGQPQTWFAPYRDEALDSMWLSDLCITQWRSFDKKILAAALSPDGRRVAYVTDQGKLDVCGWNDGQLLCSAMSQKEIRAIAFMGNQRIFTASTSQIECMELLGSATDLRLEQNWRLKLDKDLYKFWLNENLQLLAVSDSDRTTIYKLETGQEISHVPAGDFKEPTSISFHPSRPLYLICSYHHPVVELRDINTHQTLWREHGGQGFSSCVWSPDGDRFIASGTDNRKLKLYSLASTSLQPELFEEVTHPFGSGAELIWTSNGSIVSRDWDGHLQLYDVAHNRQLLRLSLLALPYHVFGCLAKDDDAQRWMSIVHGNDTKPTELGLLEMESGVEQQLLTRQHLERDWTFFVSEVLQLGGFVDSFNQLTLLSLVNGQIIARIKLPGIAQGMVTFDATHLYWVQPDVALKFDMQLEHDRLILSHPRRTSVHCALPKVAVSKDGAVQVLAYWNGYSDTPYCGMWVQTANEPAPRKIYGLESGSLGAVSPDARQALLSYRYKAWVCELESLKVRELTPHYHTQTAAFSADGKYAMAGGILWNTHDWSRVELVEPSLASSEPRIFSADGTHVVYHSKEGKSQFVELATGKLYLQLEGVVQYYDSIRGKLVMETSDGVFFRHLNQATGKLSRLGLAWSGPQFQAETSSRIQTVELAPELQSLKTFTEWVESIDRMALEEAETNPTDGHAAFQAAKVYIDHAQYDNALKQLERAATLMPDAITPRLWSAYVLAAQGKFAEAIEASSELVGRNPDQSHDHDLRLQRASWLIEMNRPELALLEVDAAEKTQPLYLRRCLAFRTMAYRALGDADMADCHHVLYKLDLPIATQLCYAAFPMVEHDISLRNPRLAAFYLEHFEGDSDPLIQLCKAYIKLRLGEYSLAIESAASALNDPDIVNRCLGTGISAIANARLGNKDLAAQQLAEVAKLFPVENRDQWSGNTRSLRILMGEARAALNPTGP